MVERCIWLLGVQNKYFIPDLLFKINFHRLKANGGKSLKTWKRHLLGHFPLLHTETETWKLCLILLNVSIKPIHICLGQKTKTYFILCKHCTAKPWSVNLFSYCMSRMTFPLHLPWKLTPTLAYKMVNLYSQINFEA